MVGELAGQRFKHGHADRNAHFNLLSDHAAGVIGNGGGDFDAAIHGAGMHDQSVRLGTRELFMIEAEVVIIFARRGHERAFMRSRCRRSIMTMSQSSSPLFMSGEDFDAETVN